MNKLPLNFVIFVSTSQHFGHDTYQTTINHYKAKLGGSLDIFQHAFAHVKVKPTEKDRLPGIIEFLLENDIKPIITEGDWARGLSHGREYLKDMFKVYNTEALHSAPYTFFCEDDEPVHLHQGTLVSYLDTAIGILASNKDILNIRFQRDGVLNVTRPINDFLNQVDTTDFQPFVARIRDLFLTTKTLQDNAKQFENTQCELAFRIASDTLSYSPYRYLCFNPKLATSYHIGAPDYLEIIKGPDFTSNVPTIKQWAPSL